MNTVSLLTDFGLRDGYVGQLKAAVLRVCPTARLVDHEPCVRQTKAALFGCSKEDVSSGAGNPAGSNHCDRRAHESDHVVNGVSGLDVTSRGRNKHADRSIRFLRQSNTCAQTAPGLRYGIADLASRKNAGSDSCGAVAPATETIAIDRSPYRKWRSSSPLSSNSSVCKRNCDAATKTYFARIQISNTLLLNLRTSRTQRRSSTFSIS